MKKIILSAFALFLLFSPQAFAHTYLDFTKPGDGDILTTDIQTIELSYSGKIEEGSFFKLEGSQGNEIPVSSFTVNNGVLKGQLDTPLKNDTYTVKWNSISQDGHPMSGNYSFTVNKPVTEQNEEVKNEEQTDKVNTEQEAENTVSSVDEENIAETKSPTPTIFVSIFLVAIFLIGGLIMWKRKK